MTTKPSQFRITNKTLAELSRKEEMLRNSANFQYSIAGDKAAAEGLYIQADLLRDQWRADYEFWKAKRA